MFDEVFVDVPYYEGLYLISNYGRIKSVERDVFMPNGIRNGHIEEHYVPQHDNGNGYLFVTLWKNNKGKREYVHRLVALAFIPNPDHKPQVDHIDTDRLNNRANNLRWVTNSENIKNPITLERLVISRTTQEYKDKMHIALSGDRNGARTHPEKNYFVTNNPGKAFKGTHYYNNGVVEVRSNECPDGFVRGRI